MQHSCEYQISEFKSSATKNLTVAFFAWKSHRDTNAAGFNVAETTHLCLPARPGGSLKRCRNPPTYLPDRLNSVLSVVVLQAFPLALTTRHQPQSLKEKGVRLKRLIRQFRCVTAPQAHPLALLAIPSTP